MMTVEPGAKGPVPIANGLQAAGVFDGGGDFQAIPYDGRVSEQPGYIGLVEGGDGVNVEPAVGLTETGAFAQDGGPTEASLIDLQHEPFEERGIGFDREAVLFIMIGPMERVPDGGEAVRSGRKF